jgi:hypothetical protein
MRSRTTIASTVAALGALAMVSGAHASPMPAAAFSPPPRADAERTEPLTTLPDIVLTRGPATAARRAVIASDIDAAVTSPGGEYTVAGTAMYSSRGATGGRATLYATPRGGRPRALGRIPVTNVDYFRTKFSPDGKYLVVDAHTGLLRDPGSTPTLTVFSVPNLAVVRTVPGVDPYWIGARSIAYRDGRTPFRLDVGGSPRPLGPPHPTYGCTVETFGPYTPCRSDLYTNILGITPDGSGWIVNDTSDTKNIDRLRIMRLASGEDHVAFDQGAADPSVEESFVGNFLPSKSRVCETVTRANGPNGAKRTELRCVVLADESRERYVLGDEALGASWVADDRVLLYSGRGQIAGIVDLNAKTMARIVGTGGALYPTALAGGRRLVFTSSGELADLDAGTLTPLVAVPPGHHLQLATVPGESRRVLAYLQDYKHPARWEMIDF